MMPEQNGFKWTSVSDAISCSNIADYLQAVTLKSLNDSSLKSIDLTVSFYGQ